MWLQHKITMMYLLFILSSAALISKRTASPVQPSQQTMTISMLQGKSKVDVTVDQELLMQILDGLGEQKDILRFINKELQKLNSKKNFSQSMNENMLPVEFVKHLLNILTGSGSASTIYPSYFVAPIDKSGFYSVPIAQSPIESHPASSSHYSSVIKSEHKHPDIESK